MLQAVHVQPRRDRPFPKAVLAMLCMHTALVLALLDGDFVNRVLDLSGFSAFGLVWVMLLALFALLFVAFTVNSDEMEDEPLMLMFICAFIIAIGIGGTFLAARWANQANGWRHLLSMGHLQSVKSSIISNEGSLEHPKNHRIVSALSSRNPKDTIAASHWIENQGMLPSSESRRAQRVLSLLGQANAPLTRDIAARGWMGKEDVKKWRRWALANPPAPTASTLHSDAWLRLSGEKAWSEALSVEAPATQEAP